MLKFRGIVLAFLLLIATLSFAGCKECIGIERVDVKVVVVDAYHRAAYVTPVRCGKSTMFVSHPAVYKITVRYNGTKYVIPGRETYQKYKNKIGKTVTGQLEIATYDDGTTTERVISLE